MPINKWLIFTVCGISVKLKYLAFIKLWTFRLLCFLLSHVYLYFANTSIYSMMNYQNQQKQSQRGLFTFYKQQQQYERYRYLEEKQKKSKNIKNKSKRKSKNKPKKSNIKSDKNITGHLNDNSSVAIQHNSKVDIDKNQNISVDINKHDNCVRQQFLRKILNKKTYGNSIIPINLHPAHQITRNKLLTQGNYQDTDAATVFIHGNSQQLVRMKSLVSQKLSPDRTSISKIDTSQQISNQNIQALEQIMHGKVKNNFFRVNRKDNNLAEESSEQINYRKSLSSIHRYINISSLSKSNDTGKRQYTEHKQQEPYSPPSSYLPQNKMKIVKSEKFKLPGIKNIRMSKQLNHINQIVQKNLMPVYRYDSNKSKKTLKKNAYTNKSDNKIIILKSEPIEQKKAIMKISKVDFEDGHRIQLHTQWELQKKNLLKKLGLHTKISNS